MARVGVASYAGGERGGLASQTSSETSVKRRRGLVSDDRRQVLPAALAQIILEDKRRVGKIRSVFLFVLMLFSFTVNKMTSCDIQLSKTIFSFSVCEKGHRAF